MKYFLSAAMLVLLPALCLAKVDAEAQSSETVLKADKITVNSLTNEGWLEGHAHVMSSTADMKADTISMNYISKEGHAEGNVKIVQGSSTLTGSEAFYNWETSTGSFLHAHGVSLPWHFSAEKMTQKGQGLFFLEDGEFTSCDANPPHFHMRASKGKIIVGKRATTKQTRMVLDDTPVLFSPVYTRSLVPKKYRFRVEPGQSGRDGLIAKTSLGYPITANTYTTARWDWLELTGNNFGLNHRYFAPKVKGTFDFDYVRDINPDPEPQAKRYKVDWNHYQVFTPQLSARAKVDFVSDQDYGNQFVGGSEDRVINETRGLLSEGGFTYQLPKVTFELDADRQDRFDSVVSSKSYVAHVTLPRLSMSTIPLKPKWMPFYTSFSGHYVSETVDRESPEETLRYEKSGLFGTQIKHDLRIKKKWTLTPRLGYDQTWQDRDFTEEDATHDVYRGRYNAGIDARRRFMRLIDLTAGYSYVARLRINSPDLDTGADDRGIEKNAFALSVVSRIGRNSRVSLSSGYNILDAPRSDPTLYDHSAARVLPPSLDLQWEIAEKVNLYFRETYSVYDSSLRKNVRTPVNTSTEIQWGDLNDRTFFTQGFSYTKTAPADPALTMNNRMRFFLSPGWFVDGLLSYQAQGSERMNYHKVKPIEKTFTFVRDLHCWVLRMEFSKRTDRSEASFYIDLKTNMGTGKKVFDATHPESAFYEPLRQPDVSEIFPDPAAN